MLGGKNQYIIYYIHEQKTWDFFNNSRNYISYHCLTSVFSQVYKETELGILIIPFGQHLYGQSDSGTWHKTWSMGLDLYLLAD